MKAMLRLILALFATAAAAEDVLWILPEFPPSFILGPFRTGEGYGDRQLDFLIPICRNSTTSE